MNDWMIWLALGAIAGWAGSILWGHSRQRKPAATVDDLFPPRTYGDGRMSEDEVKALVNAALIKLVDRKLDEAEDRIARKVFFAAVVACRASRKPMSDDRLKEFRMGLYVRSNELYDFAVKYHPVLDMPRPPDHKQN